MSDMGQTNYLKGHYIPMLGAPALHTNSVLVGGGHLAAPKVCTPQTAFGTQNGKQSAIKPSPFIPPCAPRPGKSLDPH